MDAWLKKANPGLATAPKASSSAAPVKSNGSTATESTYKRPDVPFKPVNVAKAKREIDPTAVPWVEK